MKEFLRKLYSKVVCIHHEQVSVDITDIEHTLELYKEFDHVKYSLYHELLKTEQILKTMKKGQDDS